MKHLPDDMLERHALGRLPEPEAQSVEEHLLICHECQDRHEETLEFVMALRALAVQLTPKDGSNGSKHPSERTENLNRE